MTMKSEDGEKKSFQRHFAISFLFIVSIAACIYITDTILELFVFNKHNPAWAYVLCVLLVVIDVLCFMGIIAIGEKLLTALGFLPLQRGMKSLSAEHTEGEKNSRK